ncbi:MAG: 50S ribosomal protein L29 [Elusimicrobia bacterium HGW-Elusimicrobia-1]|jgi:large subunit ribosomal protein L29|nr:MAG: 50S ribosomal protein L29 [Elusimicrobia bacterium HGW-Elusimicrobia-1]
MKSKDWEQLKNSTDAELNAKLDTLRRRRSELEFRNKTAKVKNPLEIRAVRRVMARIKTILRARELISVAAPAKVRSS